MATQLVLPLAAACGVASHLGYFIRNEHHLEGPRIVRSLLLLPFGIFFLYWRYGSVETDDALKLTAAVTSTYVGALCTSMAIYRAFFHRLADFPGPFAARVSKMYHLAHIVRKSDQYRFYDNLHKKYGDYVRTGPKEIAIFSPDAVPVIHGSQSKCVRGEWYDNIVPLQSVFTQRLKKNHAARIKLWDQAYSFKSLRSYEPTILKNTELLAHVIEKRCGQTFDATRWFEYYGFDVAGEVEFSRSFGMLENEGDHRTLEIFKGGLLGLGVSATGPWIIHLIYASPIISRPWYRMKGWVADTIRKRIDNKDAKRDAFSWLLASAEEKGTNGVEQDWNYLMGDFLIMITGGTEPVISGLTFTFMHLASKQEYIDKVRAEIATLSSYSDNRQLQALPFLNAMIYESFRLHPSIPSGGYRNTPPEGVHIGDTFIPGDTTVLIPQYTLHRREDCFTHADQFIPERWTTRPELIKDRRAYVPWGTGTYACVGKNLGLMEIRTAIVLLIDRFDVKFAPGEDGSTLVNETRDLFTTVPAALNLVFEPRKSGPQMGTAVATEGAAATVIDETELPKGSVHATAAVN